MSLDALLKKYKNAIDLASVPRPKTFISLGPLSLNIAIGDTRGVETGRIVQIVGKQSSGKSTLALDIIAQHQEATGLPVLYVDFERSLDPDYARACGVDLERLYQVRADTTEEGLDAALDFIKSGSVKLIIIDSIAAAMPSSEEEKDMKDSPKMASNAGLITRFCNKVVPLLDNNDVLLVVLNQLRKNFSTLSPETEIPFGGMSLQYATAVMIRMAAIKNEERTMTAQTIIRKNKVGAPQARTEFKIVYGRGIDHAADIVELAIERNIVNKSGAWFTFGEYKAQGMEKAKVEFPIQQIRQLILERL